MGGKLIKFLMYKFGKKRIKDPDGKGKLAKFISKLDLEDSEFTEWIDIK